MKNKLTFISQVFYPDPGSTSILFSPLIANLVDGGWEVDVLCGFPDVGSSEAKRVERWRGVTIRRCGLQIRTKKNLFLRALSYASFLSELLLRLLVSRSGSRIMAVTNPPFIAWVLLVAKKLRNHSYHYFFLDLHPEGLIALGSLKNESVMVKIWQKLNMWSYSNASSLAVLGRDMKIALAHYQLSCEGFHYIPHWSAYSAVAPLSYADSKFVSERDLDGKFVVQYSGNMGLWHDIETLILAANTLREHSNIQFNFIGDGVRRARAEALSERLALENVKWFPFVDEELLAESLAACHVALISLRADLSGVAVPCKFYGILESGRAVIAQVPTESEVALTVKEHDCGRIVQPGDWEGLANAVLEMSENRPSTELMGVRGFNAAKIHYSLAAATDKVEKFLMPKA